MKYWAYIDNEVLGPYEKEKLIQLPGFTPAMLVCPQTPVGEKTEEWKEASNFPEIMALLNIPTAQTQSLSESSPASAETPTQVEPADHDTSSQIKKIAGTSFDPLTLSQLGRRLEAVKKDEIPVRLPEDFTLSKPFIKKEPLSEPASAPEPASQLETEPPPAIAPEPSPEQIEQEVGQPPEKESPSPAPDEEKQEPGSISPLQLSIDPMTLSQVNRNLQEVINSGILKQDFPEQIKFIIQKIGQIEEKISMFQKSLPQKEIFDKISRLENSINEIKTKIAEKPISAPPPSLSATPVFVPPTTPLKKEEVPPPQTPEKKEEIHDEGEKANKFLTGVFKKLLRVVMSLVLICGILVVAVFILKQLDIVDVTNIIDIPFISKTQKTETLQKAEIEPKPQTEFSQEAINMVKEYMLEPGGDKLETIINKEANLLQTDINFGKWTTIQISQDIYNVTISIPYNNGQSNLIYAFEVDFKNKVIKPLDEETKKLFETDKVPQQPQQQITQQEEVQKPVFKLPRKRGGRRPTRIRRDLISLKSANQVQYKPTQRKPAQKPTEEDEEYEYEYIEEESTAGK